MVAVSNKVDMSLADIISSNKKTRGSRGRFGQGRGRFGQGRGRGGRGRGRGSLGQRNGVFTQRGRGSSVRGGARGRGLRRGSFGRSNINSNWSHDMYFGGASGRSVGITSTGPTKLNIINLDYGVSDSDIRELFSEFGAMRAAAVHYDRTGRSIGTAHVMFERRADALKALRQYNGVHLDGRPMNITIEGQSAGVVAARASVRRLQQSEPRPIGGRGRRGRGRARGGAIGRGRRGLRGGMRGGRGGRGAKAKVPTSDELDAELDAYVNEVGK